MIEMFLPSHTLNVMYPHSYGGSAWVYVLWLEFFYCWHYYRCPPFAPHFGHLQTWSFIIFLLIKQHFRYFNNKLIFIDWLLKPICILTPSKGIWNSSILLYSLQGALSGFCDNSWKMRWQVQKGQVTCQNHTTREVQSQDSHSNHMISSPVLWRLYTMKSLGCLLEVNARLFGGRLKSRWQLFLLLLCLSSCTASFGSQNSTCTHACLIRQDVWSRGLFAGLFTYQHSLLLLMDGISQSLFLSYACSYNSQWLCSPSQLSFLTHTHCYSEAHLQPS